MEVTDEMRERMARIRANRTALDNCPRHAFGELPAMAFGMKLTCQRCGGVMDAIEAGLVEINPDIVNEAGVSVIFVET